MTTLLCSVGPDISAIKETKMISMTYGTMPSREDFDFALARENAESGYRFGNDKRVGTCTLTPDELWDELQSSRTEWLNSDGKDDTDDGPGDWCSAVLYTLGFEWI